MLYLYERGQADYLSLAEELERHHQLEQCGGSSYLLELAAAVPELGDVRHDAAIIAYLAQQRREAQQVEQE